MKTLGCRDKGNGNGYFRMHCAGQPDNADETKRQSTADQPRD